MKDYSRMGNPKGQTRISSEPKNHLFILKFSFYYKLYYYNIMTRRRSNTLEKKVQYDESLEDRSLHNQTQQGSSLIKVYFRKANNQFRILEVPNLITTPKLFQIIEKEFYIRKDQQILFFKNERFEFGLEKQSRMLLLGQKDIIHIHNRQQINKQLLNISLEYLNVQLIKISSTKITVNSKEIIGNSIEESFLYNFQNICKFRFVQSGRFLNIEKSYMEEAVESDSIILVVENDEGNSSLHKLQEREIELIDWQRKSEKVLGINLNEIEQKARDFKKKYECQVFKSFFIPDSKEFAWQLQYRIGNATKIIQTKKITKLRRGKNKQRNTCNEKKAKLVDKPLNLLLQKNCPLQTHSLDLQDYGRKKPETSYLYKQINKLKPPQISEDFFQEIQEIQFDLIEPSTKFNYEGTGEDDGEFSGKDLYSSAPLMREVNNLGSSIGKCKGIFIPVIMSNLQNFDDDFEDLDD